MRSVMVFLIALGLTGCGHWGPLQDADRCKVRKQLARLHDRGGFWARNSAYREIRRDWVEAVQELVDMGKIRVGTSRSVVEGLLGKPTSTSEHEGTVWLRWYFSTPMHVNPAFDVEVKDDKVVSFGFTSA